MYSIFPPYPLTPHDTVLNDFPFVDSGTIRSLQYRDFQSGLRHIWSKGISKEAYMLEGRSLIRRSLNTSSSGPNT